MHSIDIHPCTQADLERLRSLGVASRAMARHEQKFAMQPDEGVFFVAWNGDTPAGFATLLRHSKYKSVQGRLGEFPEINALEATPQGQGIGTAIIHHVENEAKAGGARLIGLAVEEHNARARALYNRLGYVEWENGVVIDRWFDLDDEGNQTTENNDECRYLTKPLA